MLIMIILPQLSRLFPTQCPCHRSSVELCRLLDPHVLWGTLTIGVTFTYPFRLPPGPHLCIHLPTTALTPQFLSLSPSSSITAPDLLFDGPCQGDGTGPGVHPLNHRDYMDLTVMEGADLSLHGSHHPNPTYLQEEAGSWPGKSSDWIFPGCARVEGGNLLLTTTLPYSSVPASSPWPPLCLAPGTERICSGDLSRFLPFGRTDSPIPPP